ncbi:lysine transporter LysE [Paenibacillus yonginensis]|uniref:Lysine transporter LysE n=1 Tax=Paenibacillus yonginensis TaxID=1462996 RepID=A0A1B1MYX9_9BACL|nr:LysE/ArgO family amino acid transporter [Paenibacillus yonginensis]ANS74385.1 lysine transporter LysE [Paenibacillus yonginensis]
MLTAFIHGFILALGLILPLGVQNVFIFNQGAQQRRFLLALPAVLTAALCDTLLILLAVTGVSLLLLDTPWLKTLLMAVGLLFLVYMGWQTWRSSFSVPKSADDGQGKPAGVMTPRQQMGFAASVSLLNPHAIMDTVGVIGSGSLNYDGMDKAAFAAACVLVSWLWFAGLAYLGRRLGTIDSTGRLSAGIQRISAFIIWGTALYIGFTLMGLL